MHIVSFAELAELHTSPERIAELTVPVVDENHDWLSALLPSVVERWGSLDVAAETAARYLGDEVGQNRWVIGVMSRELVAVEGLASAIKGIRRFNHGLLSRFLPPVSATQVEMWMSQLGIDGNKFSPKERQEREKAVAISLMRLVTDARQPSPYVEVYVDEDGGVRPDDPSYHLAGLDDFRSSNYVEEAGRGIGGHYSGPPGALTTVYRWQPTRV